MTSQTHSSHLSSRPDRRSSPRPGHAGRGEIAAHWSGSLGARIAATALLLLNAGCSVFPTDGGFHREGERRASARAFYGNPIKGKALAWHGLGDVPNFGGGVRGLWYDSDRLAYGLEANFIHFKPLGKNVTGGEIAGRLRYHFFETERLGFFWDFGGGYVRTESKTPPGGTRGNYTFALGPGVEVPLHDGQSLLFGVEFHHMSNALGRQSPRNPSQNESRIWLGYSVTW